MYQRQGPPVRLGPSMTPLTRNVLIGLVALYVVQVILANWVRLPVLEVLGWGSPWSERFPFRPWQPVTAFFLNGPTPFNALIEWLVLYFFLPPAEMTLGRRGLVRVLLVSWVAAVAVSLPLLYLGVVGVSMPYLGLDCFLTALIVVFGLSQPHARILLFFVLPIRASWVAWGTGLVSFLYFLYSRELVSSVAFFGWCGAVLWMYGGTNVLRRWLDRRGPRRPRRKDSRFHVIDGGRDEGGPPIYH